MIAGNHRHHECTGSDEQSKLRVRPEEDQQRTKFGGELEQRMRRSFFQGGFFQVGDPLVVLPGDGAGEIASGKGREIIDPFADTDEMHREFVFS